jgi:hypothetical protein
MADSDLSKLEQAQWAAMAAATSGSPAASNADGASPAADAESTQSAPPDVAGEQEPVDDPQTAAEDDVDQDEGAAKPARKVDFGAFHRERSQRQNLEAENRRLIDERARFDERLRVIQELNAPQQQQYQPPAQDDYVGRIEANDQRMARMEAYAQQQYQQQQQQAQVAAVRDAMLNDGQQFAAKTPDFDRAFNHWSQSRAEELKQLGFAADDIPTQLRSDQWQIGQAAFQRGASPAAVFYSLAQQRGYRKGNGNGNGGDDGGDYADEATAQISRISRGQARSPTLSGSGGSAAPNSMTAQMLLNMSNEEFSAWTSKHQQATDRLYGKEILPRRR